MAVNKSKSQTMHKLLDDHKWKAKGFDFVCECGAVKKNANSVTVFKDDSIIDAAAMNHNFETLEDAIRVHKVETSLLRSNIEDAKHKIADLVNQLKEAQHGR